MSMTHLKCRNKLALLVSMMVMSGIAASLTSAWLAAWNHDASPVYREHSITNDATINTCHLLGATLSELRPRSLHTSFIHNTLAHTAPPYWIRDAHLPYHNDDSLAIINAYGFPWRCFMYTCTSPDLREMPISLDLQMAGAISGGLGSTNDGWGSSDSDILVLPIQPLWRNLILNILSWGLFISALVFAPIALFYHCRNLWRRNRGSCTACGHRLIPPSRTRCTECGQNRSFSSWALPSQAGLILIMLFMLATTAACCAMLVICYYVGQNTNLQEAAYQCDLNRITSLLRNGNDPDQIYDFPSNTYLRNSTPLFVAARVGCNCAITALLDAGADIDFATYEEWTAVQEAAAHGQAKSLDLLLSRGANVRGRNGFHLAAWAAYYGQRESLTVALPDPHDPSFPETVDQAMHLAAAAGHAPIIEYLLDCGASPNSQMNGRTVLMSAARSGDVDCVATLVAKGASGSKADSVGWTVLFYINVNAKATWSYIIESGVDVNARAKYQHGKTALMYWAEADELTVVKWLLSVGADPAITDDRGLLAIDLTTDEDIKTLLREKTN